MGPVEVSDASLETIVRDAIAAGEALAKATKELDEALTNVETWMKTVAPNAQVGVPMAAADGAWLLYYNGRLLIGPSQISSTHVRHSKATLYGRLRAVAALPALLVKVTAEVRKQSALVEVGVQQVRAAQNEVERVRDTG